MNKFYGAHDQWTDLDKQNDVLITSIDGVIDSVKVNGEDYGGGSSDFSTAEVTVINETGIPFLFMACLALEEDGEYSSITSETVMSESVFSVIMYKGLAYGTAEGVSSDVITTGNVSYNEGVITVTGDGTITFTGGTPK